MSGRCRIAVVVPLLNDESSVGKVIDGIPTSLQAEVICVDCGSTDRSAEVARSRGARVVQVWGKGYGTACMVGVRAASDPDIIVFIDGDLSHYSEDIPSLVEPILRDEADMVIGSRILGSDKLPFDCVLGNRMATGLLRTLFGLRRTDAAPFRAVAYDWLTALDVRSRNFGWMIEMLARAAARGYHIREVPVRYRRRLREPAIGKRLNNCLRAAWTSTHVCLGAAFQEKLMPHLVGRRKPRRSPVSG